MTKINNLSVEKNKQSHILSVEKINNLKVIIERHTKFSCARRRLGHSDHF